MNIEIKNFLIDQETPEMIDIYEQAWDLLVALGSTEFSIVIDELMMMSAGDNIESFLKHFREIMHVNLDIVIEEHGLFPVDGAPILFKIMLLEFFIAIERTELITECVRLLESDETSDTELFCEVVSTVIGNTVDDIIIYLQPVQNAVVSNMRAYMQQREELEHTMDSIEDEDIREHYKALEEYCRVMKAQTTVGFVLAFQTDGRVGGVFKDLLNIHLNNMNRKSVGEFAKELVSLVLCSDSWKNPQIEIESILPTITENLKELAHIQKAVGNELQMWKIEITKGV